MKERIKELAKDYLVHERFGRYGESVTEDYYEFYPDDLAEFAELIIREYSYDVMNLHGAKPERVQYAAKCWGVEV